MKRRCYLIDVMKTLFTVAIALFHAAILFNDKSIPFAQHGSIGVEFFFVVSGWLLCSAAEKQDRSESIALATRGFVLKRYFYYLRYHVFGTLCCFAVTAALGSYSLMNTLTSGIRMLPNLFLIQMTGIIQNDVNSVDWYLSVLVISFLILYPLLLKDRDLTACVIAPAAALLILGNLYHRSDLLGGVEEWTGLFYKGFLRGFAELLLGIVCFRVSGWLSRLPLRRFARLLLTLLECGGYLAALAYAGSSVTNSYDYFCLLLLCCAVTVSFSGVSFTARFRMPDKLDSLLTKMGLALYVCQVACGTLVQRIFHDDPTPRKVLYYFLFLIPLAMLCVLTAEWLGRVSQRRRHAEA